MKHHNILTPKGERYVAEHSNVIVAFRLRDPLFAVQGITAQDVRHAVEAEVDRLIHLLDAFDGDDDDLEDGGDDEPSFGVQVNGQCELELDTADDEPSLGWHQSDEHTSQSTIGMEMAFFADLEDEHDGREPDNESDGDPDLEPSLGSPEIGPTDTYWIHSNNGRFTFGASQERWANGIGYSEEECVNEDGDDADFAA